MIRSSLRAFLVLLFALVAARDLAAETTDSLRIERLTRLGKLWGTIRYLHPSLAYRNLDWDAALFAAVPHVRAAETPEQYAAAIQGMLDALSDPTTRVQPQVVRVVGPGNLSRFQWIDERVLAVDLRAWDFETQEEMNKAFQALRAEIPRAQAVVLDARGRGEPVHSIYFLEEIQDLLVTRPARTPAQRSVFHSGYRTQLGLSSGGYYSGLITLQGEELAPGQGAVPRVVFVTDASTLHAPLVAALQATGDGLIVSEGPFRGDGFVQSTTVELGEGFQAVVRTTETLPLPGWPGPHADLEVPPASPDGPDTALEAALRLAREEIQPQAPPADAPPLPEAVWQPDKTYPGEPFPPLEHRLLAVYRIWNIINLFYPYKHLIGDWNPVLPEFVARMEAARDGREYAVALAEMTARTLDTHTTITGHPELAKIYGTAPAPVVIRWIEDSWLVTGLRDDPETRASGIELGDVILEVDGQPVAVRESLLTPLLPASNEAGLRRRLSDRLLAGSPGPMTLTVRGRGDRVRTVSLQRAAWTWTPSGEVVRLLPDNIGYIDLTRLTPPEIDAAFKKIADTRALILDMRGYPQGTVFYFAGRLNTKSARHAAVFRREVVSAMTEGESLQFEQPIPPASGPLYQGKTVMLIDERAISQSEHSGLFLEAANGTKFIGTPTSGANGDITYFTVPGGITVRFAAHDVRHADGRQLQRIGLVPDIEVAPTIQGIRDGRDEVLERAMRYLSEEAPAPR